MSSQSITPLAGEDSAVSNIFGHELVTTEVGGYAKRPANVVDDALLIPRLESAEDACAG